VPVAVSSILPGDKRAARAVLANVGLILIAALRAYAVAVGGPPGDEVAFAIETGAVQITLSRSFVDPHDVGAACTVRDHPRS